MENKFNMPTEVIDLPSKGLIYPETSPLSSGKIEMKYMTAKEEDILTNQNYIQKGIVLDELIKSLITTPGVKYEDLITGDKNALLVAARVLGYGKDYTFTYSGEEQTIDLSLIENKTLDESLFTKGKNEFEYTLPSTDTKITFKLLTGHDEKKINNELEGIKKINKNAAPELSTRLKYMITSVEGNTDSKTIREFVDNHFLARDSRAFREYIKEVQPDVDLTFFPDGSDSKVNIPVGLSFFWPDL
jgi:hypothetical protein